MTTPELLAFVRTQLSKGTSRDAIKSLLGGAGWDEEDIKEAFNIIQPPAAPSAPVDRPVPISPVNSPDIKPTVSANPTGSSGSVFVQPRETSIPGVTFVNPNPTTPLMPAPAPSMPMAHREELNSNTEVHPKKSHFIPVLIVILLFLLISGGGVAAYYLGYFDSTGSTITSMQKNVGESTSGRFDATISMKSNYNDPSKNPPPLLGLDFSNIIIQMKGASQYDPQGDKYNLNLSLNIGSIQVSLQFRFLNNVLYAMLDKAPVFGLADLSQYQNRWFAFDLSNKQDTSANMIPVVGVGKSALDKLTKEEIAELEELTTNANFVKILKKNGSDKLEGVDTTRYLFDLDKAGIIDYLVQVKNFMTKLANKDSSFSTLADIDTVYLSQELDKVKNFHGEIWIGKKDKFPHKLTISFTTDLKEGENVVGNFETDIFMLMNDWNMPVRVDKPESAEDLQSLINASLEDARSKGRDAAIKANLSSVRVYAELFYDSNNGLGYKGFCKTSGEFNPQQNFTSINENTKPATVVCKDSTNRWIAYAPISTGEYWCVDSQGASKASTKIPVGMVCN